ncbi:helix-turn-helix transcriptional regulator [Cereibacter sp. SYSU M97828]|nr:helix-turn-helix transcriptional regulator [Cereibacter flavus]
MTVRNDMQVHMTSPDDHELRAEIVDRLYDVALDPMRFEDLIDAWEGRGGAADDPAIDAHMSRARVFLDRYDASREGGGARAVLDAVHRSAAFLSDGVSGIVACNRAMELAFGIREGAPLSALPFDQDEVASLSGAILRVAGGKAEKVATLRLRSSQTGSPVIVRIAPVVADGPRPLALVQSTELVWPDGFEAAVQEAFGLTLAEVEIVRGISMGQPVRDIAGARGRSVDTVRTQLRSILAKTETHSQSELVRVVLGLMDLSHPPREGAELVGLPFRTLRLRDGRRLDWIEFGDPNGAPLLFMHLDYGLIRWPAPAERRAAQRGIRVIVPVRAGYGASDLHPRGTDHLTGVTLDYAAVLDHLNIRRVAVIALGADLRFAMNLSILRPGLVTGILGCAAQLPLRSRAQYERMDKWQRFILRNARYAPRILPFMVQAAFAVARKMGKDAFFRHVNGGSPADVALMDRPEVRDALLLGSEVCLSRGRSAHEAFTRECIGSEKDWSAVVRACRVPTVLLQADRDPQTPVVTVQELIEDFPNLSAEFLPGTGQLLFFQEWETALRRIDPMLP